MKNLVELVESWKIQASSCRRTATSGYNTMDSSRSWNSLADVYDSCANQLQKVLNGNNDKVKSES
jgi:hypothetical protein